MISRILNWVGPSLAIVLIGVSVYYFIAFAPEHNIAMPTKLIEAQRVGDYVTVLAELDAIRNDPTKTTEEKAIATFSADGARFHLTGNIDDRLQDIRDIKAAITDPTVPEKTKAYALNVLAASFNDMGRDAAVFTEVFKDAPFNAYLTPGDPELSFRRLFEWSYEMFPTYWSAIRISKWYAEQYVYNPNQPIETTKAYAERAVEFLNKADALIASESRRDPEFLSSARYIEYRHWRAVNVGRLSRQIGEPYTSQYRQGFEDYLALAEASPSAYARGSKLFGRYLYAARMFLDNDTVAVKTQLDLLAADMNAIENPDVVAFALFLRNTRSQPTGLNWTFIKNVSELSPAFKAAVDRFTVTPALPTSAGQWSDNF